MIYSLHQFQPVEHDDVMNHYSIGCVYAMKLRIEGFFRLIQAKGPWQMLLTVDVGNTNITLGVYKGRNMIADWRVRTDRERTADEHGLLFTHLLQHRGMNPSDIHGVAISSVVPTMNDTLVSISKQYFLAEPMVVGPDTDFGLKVYYSPVSDVGADRLVNAVAVKQKYGGPAIVVDFGTATTFDAISDCGDYLGGAIAPGIGISVNALFHSASRLFRVELIAPGKAVGTNTAESMQSGIIYGYAGQVDALVERIRVEIGQNARVIATGGLATLISKETKHIDTVDMMLTLDGLQYLWERNHTSLC
jgi:type III pantothenate kinase